MAGRRGWITDPMRSAMCTRSPGIRLYQDAPMKPVEAAAHGARMEARRGNASIQGVIGIIPGPSLSIPTIPIAGLSPPVQDHARHTIQQATRWLISIAGVGMDRGRRSMVVYRSHLQVCPTRW